LTIEVLNNAVAVGRCDLDAVLEGERQGDRSSASNAAVPQRGLEQRPSASPYYNFIKG